MSRNARSARHRCSTELEVAYTLALPEYEMTCAFAAFFRDIDCAFVHFVTVNYGWLSKHVFGQPVSARRVRLRIRLPSAPQIEAFVWLSWWEGPWTRTGPRSFVVCGGRGDVVLPGQYWIVLKMGVVRREL